VGEQGIRAAGCTHAILRTSWVFSAHGSNFVKTMLRLSESRDALSVVDDQIGGPTPARAIAAACLSIAQQLFDDRGKTGTYHFSGAPDVSWCAFARDIFAQARRATRVSPIGTPDYPTPAARPLNSRLDCQTTEQVFGIPRPDWRAGLTETVTELGITT
jgi:dTDP-4-dehydrorhamnose reductase